VGSVPPRTDRPGLEQDEEIFDDAIPHRRWLCYKIQTQLHYSEFHPSRLANGFRLSGNALADSAVASNRDRDNCALRRYRVACTQYANYGRKLFWFF